VPTAVAADVAAPPHQLIAYAARQNSSSSPHLGFHVIVGGPSILVDQARDGTATLDHSREVDRLVWVVQRWSLAAELVSPMGVVVPLVVLQALEEHGVDVQKVTCQDAGRLRGQELSPGRRGPAWCRAQPGRGQNPTDRAFTDLRPESGELALDAPMTPSRVFSRQPVRPDRASRREPADAQPRPGRSSGI
jgi:hypothetical protein